MDGRKTSRRAVLGAAAGLVTTASLAACSDDGNITPPGGGESQAPVGPAVAIEPATDTTGLPVSTEIAATAEGGEITAVALTTAEGTVVKGDFREDKSSWVPEEPLDYTTTYTATVTAKGADGTESTATSVFTTMEKPGNRKSAYLWNGEGKTYGVAMPVLFQFDDYYEIDEKNRESVEKRLFVSSEPKQVGAWRWVTGSVLEYRPKEYWQPGTVVKVRIGLGGHPLGGGDYGQVDITTEFNIDDGPAREMVADNDKKKLYAKEDGENVKSIPISLGKPSTPSFYGTMVIMERLEETTFDSSTYGVPSDSADGYRTKVKYAQRMTWDGQFIHAAPWSVADQGKRNVSHGCLNMSDDNARWLFDWTRVGDPIIVKGTEKPVAEGNGWTAWNMDWETFVEGSALPPPEG